MTVSEAFDTFKSQLELPDRKQKEAADAQKEMRERVSLYLPIENSFLTGSYARHTKIDPLNDVDVFLVRNTSRTGVSTDGSGIFPGVALDQVRDAVARAYPREATIKKQNRSVNLQIAGLPLGFDLTPAWLRTPDGYWIPDTDSSSWIPSYPEVHAGMMTTANERSDGKLKPLIKMVKHWSRNNYDRLCSFHIELICADIFGRQALPNYPIGMTIVLSSLLGYINTTMTDPVYHVSKVNKSLSPSESADLVLRAKSDGQRALDALTFENAGRSSEAIAKWREIFLSGFPV
jgi:hypothetical protein